jgi:peroxiredoxin
MMGIRIWHIFLFLFISFCAAYDFIPIVRYYLIPLTGGTQAPILLVPKESESEVEWVNSPPLELSQLYAQKKCILLYFWTLSCINCIRTTHIIQALWERYKDYGLQVIGVHCPGFDFEFEPQNVLSAIEQAKLKYPIILDHHMKIWQSFGNHFWPTQYLISHEGKIVYAQFGEGSYQKEDEAIRKALIKAGANPPSFSKSSDLLESTHKIATPELYAGAQCVRREYGNKQQPLENKNVSFQLPPKINGDQIYLQGEWRCAADYVQSQGEGKIVLNYLANAPYVILTPAQDTKDLLVEVLLDDKPIPESIRGADILAINDKTYMNINQSRLYYPVAHTAPYERHTLSLNVPAGIRLYAFTFGVYE